MRYVDLYNRPILLIWIMGAISLLGDVVYEGTRGVMGPYLGLLGAGPLLVGAVAGSSEFLGYVIRVFSGSLSSRTQRPWLFVIAGYGLLLSVPMLAFVKSWPLAALLISLERAGKGIRTPSRDAILSYASSSIGRGKGFGLHEALDQIGAVGGPLLFSAILAVGGSYRDAFVILLIPVFIIIFLTLRMAAAVAAPWRLEGLEHPIDASSGRSFPGAFWSYGLFSFFTMAGLINFPLFAFHLKETMGFSQAMVPMYYAVAMGVDAVVALMWGWIYDRVGLRSIGCMPLLCLAVPLFGLSSRYGFPLIAVLVWGAAMGIHESIMRAAVAELVPPNKRASAYGIFHFSVGLGWLLGGVVMGDLYRSGPSGVICFALAMEIIAAGVFCLMLMKKA